MTDLTVTPDTKAGVCYVSFNVQETENVSVKLFNYKEELVAEDFRDNFKGHFDAHLDMGGFDDGFYLLQVQVGGQVELRRIVYRK